MVAFNLEKSINHSIAYASVLLRRQLFALFRKNKIEITPEQWIVLYYLWEKDGLSLGEIAEKAKKDNANITRIVSRMESQGLLRKSVQKNDKRIFHLHLTDKANQFKPNVMKSILESTKICANGLSAAEQETFLRLIKKIIANMENENIH